jgi:hypothetical protein
MGGGEGGIRTLDTLLTHTRFPSVRLQPLSHFSIVKIIYPDSVRITILVVRRFSQTRITLGRWLSSRFAKGYLQSVFIFEGFQIARDPDTRANCGSLVFLCLMALFQFIFWPAAGRQQQQTKTSS